MSPLLFLLLATVAGSAAGAGSNVWLCTGPNGAKEYKAADSNPGGCSKVDLPSSPKRAATPQTKPNSTTTGAPVKPPSPAQREAAFQKTARVALAVKNSLREPESLVWEEIRANDDATVICLAYRARNGFGGMNRELAIIHNGKASQKAAVWNKHCTQPLYDMMSVRYALR